MEIEWLMTGEWSGTLHASLLDHLKALLEIAFITTSLLTCIPLFPHVQSYKSDCLKIDFFYYVINDVNVYSRPIFKYTAPVLCSTKLTMFGRHAACT